MNLKVNNCGECPLRVRRDKFYDCCGHPEISNQKCIVIWYDKILDNCPIKKESIIIEISK